jgi:hypothetical protein
VIWTTWRQHRAEAAVAALAVDELRGSANDRLQSNEDGRKPAARHASFEKRSHADCRLMPKASPMRAHATCRSLRIETTSRTSSST